VHLSGYGRNNWELPLESGLLMAMTRTGKDVLLTGRRHL
jgi:hypothetical protein